MIKQINESLYGAIPTGTLAAKIANSLNSRPLGVASDTVGVDDIIPLSSNMLHWANCRVYSKIITERKFDLKNVAHLIQFYKQILKMRSSEDQIR